MFKSFAKSLFTPIARSIAREINAVSGGASAQPDLASNVCGLKPSEFNKPLADYLNSLSTILDAAGLKDMSEAASGIAREVIENPSNITPLCRFSEQLRAKGRVDEYRALVKSINLLTFFRSRHEYLHDFTDFERETYVEVVLKCAQMPESVASTVRLVEYIIRNRIPGDFVECGVWLGASPYVIGKTLMRLGDTSRRIFMYDTYEGFPYGEQLTYRTRQMKALRV